jgi:hypothetical protein
LIGSTKRGGNPAFKATLNMNGIGEAGVRRAQVTLPRSEFIDNAHFNTICTRVQFKEGAGNGERCPPGSVYGLVAALHNAPVNKARCPRAKKHKPRSRHRAR